MKTKKAIICGFFALILASAFTACPNDPPVPELTGITAVYTGTAAVYPDTPLINLKAGLTVTANFSDETSKTLEAADYELSGALAVGESKIAVSYKDKTTSFTVTVSDPAHVHAWGEWVETTAPTCVAAGVETRVCLLNAEHKETRAGAAINPNAHAWGVWEETASPTCIAAGVDARVCSLNEEHKETRAGAAINPNAHAWGAWKDVETPPTCTTTGKGARECTLCNIKDTNGVIPIDPNAHDWGGWAETTPNSETADGVETRICNRDPAHKETRVLYATGTPGLDFELINNDSAYSVYRGEVYSGDVYIPAYYNGLPVTEIGYQAFYGTSLTGITIPNSVTSIGDWAFSGCTSLTSITIPAGVTSIGEQAFRDCISLTTVTFASGSRLQTIGDWMFSGCTSLTSITIPASVTSIGEYAFYGCTSLTSITIPENVTEIGYAFYGCDNLTNVIINNDKITSWQGQFSADNLSVTFRKNIAEGAFGWWANENLTSVIIENGVTSIGSGAFDGCTGLTSITIPASVTYAGSWGVFGACAKLTNIYVDSGNANFSSAGGILYNKDKTEIIAYPSAKGSVIIPSNVTVIGNSAFNSNAGITSVTIHAGVTYIFSEAFIGCANLAGIYVDSGNADYLIEGGILYDKAKTVLHAVPPKGISGIVNIPATVTYICGGAFQYCANITGITIPASVTAIGSYAFGNCIGIASITIPASVTSVEYDVFEGWTSSQTIRIQGRSQASADAAWWGWRINCNAAIIYQ